ncbi:MAG: hypothetical protein KAF91_07625 [Nostoc sp. TH1S01]|nr:hypothetical protein [Nostoc sp. TH1S01]
MHRTKKRRLHNLLKIGLIGCQIQKLATPLRPPTTIKQTVDSGRGSTRRRPKIHLIASRSG